MTELKVGDIVRILPFEGGIVGGIRCYKEMRDCIGEIHIVTRVNSANVASIDDEGGLYWPVLVLEVVNVDGEEYAPYVYRMGKYIPVHYDKEVKVWTDDNGCCFSYYQVGLIRKLRSALLFPIFNVGERGDVVSAIRFRGKTYLAPEYLPMTGRIDVEQESLSF